MNMPSPSEKKDITKILTNFQILSNKLSSATDKEVKEWEAEQ
jgi:hypothetical protein